jgi:hypothetical protein
VIALRDFVAKTRHMAHAFQSKTAGRANAVLPPMLGWRITTARSTGLCPALSLKAIRLCGVTRHNSLTLGLVLENHQTLEDRKWVKERGEGALF